MGFTKENRIKIGSNKGFDLFLLFSMLALYSFLIFSVHAAERVIIKADGSSTVYPISEAVAEEFQKAKKGAVNVTIGISGTGGGFKKFCRGETDISNASRPILKNEIEQCEQNRVEFIELPIAYDGLAVMVNPKNNWVDKLTVEELKKIWAPESQGKITRWNQIRTGWPQSTMRLFGPGVDSGTFDYFTEAIVGKAKASRGDYTSSEDDNVLVQGIAGDINALGYFGLAYYEENKDRLKLVPIVNPKTGKAVLPSMETVMNNSYQPLSRPLFIYINKKSLDKKEVYEFVDFYLKNGKKLVREARYIPLPDSAYRLAEERFRSKKTKSVFAGEPEVGLSVEELLKREQKK
ncbi:MAG: PstS family phosphate ABC transporter substrate-binding protein [Syntrophorhabdaceae bacterium]|nr:PstS family phosphate ABC transporter substrate-binding protein [Syntrophorhabdaceae bacterium]